MAIIAVLRDSSLILKREREHELDLATLCMRLDLRGAKPAPLLSFRASGTEGFFLFCSVCATSIHTPTEHNFEAGT